MDSVLANLFVLKPLRDKFCDLPFQINNYTIKPRLTIRLIELSLCVMHCRVSLRLKLTQDGNLSIIFFTLIYTNGNK